MSRKGKKTKGRLVITGKHPKVYITEHAVEKAAERGLANRGRFMERVNKLRRLYTVNCKTRNQLPYLGHENEKYLVISGMFNKDKYHYILTYLRKGKDIVVTSVWTEDIYNRKYKLLYGTARNPQDLVLN